MSEPVIPDITKGFRDAQYYEAPPEVHVYSWSPAPAGTPGAKATQVHLHVGTPPGNVFVVRLKSARATNELIAALIDQRAHVWGKP